MVGGYCATGKSTFAHKLSELLNIPCFNKDKIKEALGDGLGNDHNLVINKGSGAVFFLMFYIAENLLKTGKTCILEGNFKFYEIEQLQALFDKYNCHCLSFIFKGDFDVLFNRYVNRDISEKRHWVHSAAGENAENFKNSHLQPRIGKTGIGKTIITDATSFSDVEYDELYGAAQRFLQSDSID